LLPKYTLLSVFCSDLALVKGGALATSSREKAHRVLKILLFVLFSIVLTLAGFYFTIRQIHSPDWTGVLGVVLLLPFGITNRIFHWFTGPGPLSPRIYQAASLLGFLLQLLYYLPIFTFLKRLFAMLKRRLDVQLMKEKD
jgi:hypothetical protein